MTLRQQAERDHAAVVGRRVFVEGEPPLVITNDLSARWDEDRLVSYYDLKQPGPFYLFVYYQGPIYYTDGRVEWPAWFPREEQPFA